VLRRSLADAQAKAEEAQVRVLRLDREGAALRAELSGLTARP
jgi:hypothetical protein